ncbi:MAG: class I SAM-dependent methyltransferase [Alphaproteobacteria bacterium]|nr:class I SAM-dependent methyltransferase [Alphaproteobacteria bacterium]
MNQNQQGPQIETAQKTPEDFAKQGAHFLAQNQPAKAQHFYVEALLGDPENKSYKAALAKCLPQVKFKGHNPRAQQAILLCLQDKDIGHLYLTTAWMEQMLFDPDMAAFKNLFSLNSFEEFQKSVNVEEMILPLNNIFFVTGLKTCLLRHVKFEILMTWLRRFFLLHASAEEKKNFVPFLCALATKCFFNEYIFELTKEEESKISEMKDSAPTLSVEEILLLGCYMPLYRCKALKKVQNQFLEQDDEDLRALYRLQIEEPLEEKEILKTLESFCEIENEISGEVQGQYEQNPYPRWYGVSAPQLSETQKQLSAGLDVLIAGCGTGQEVAITAPQMPLAQIDAIDLSRVSLSYAIRQCSEMDIGNVHFLHGDILKCKELHKEYDLICSNGVLHHMQEPQKGLESLKSILKPKGVLFISLYSEIGRRSLAPYQKDIRENGISSSVEDIRAYRKNIFEKMQKGSVEPVTEFSDFYFVSGCRDLVFHVREHRFTCLKLKEMIETLDLSLLNFGVRSPGVKQQYLKLYPDDPKGLNLDNWHEFEQKNPRSFTHMYELILGRKEEYEAGNLPEWLKRPS